MINTTKTATKLNALAIHHAHHAPLLPWKKCSGFLKNPVIPESGRSPSLFMTGSYGGS
jgi:hypothetical protein